MITHFRQTADEADISGEAAIAEGVAGDIAAREGSVEVAREVDSGDALSETRSYVVTVVPTTPRSNRASKQVVRIAGAMMMMASRSGRFRESKLV